MAKGGRANRKIETCTWRVLSCDPNSARVACTTRTAAVAVDISRDPRARFGCSHVPISQGTASCPIRPCWQWQCETVVETVCSSLWLSYSAPLSDSRSVRIILISNTLLHGGRPSEKGFSLGSTSHPLLSPSSPRAPHHCRPCCSAPPQNRKFTCPTPTSTWPWTSSPGVI